jgi:hypothetical protein
MIKKCENDFRIENNQSVHLNRAGMKIDPAQKEISLTLLCFLSLLLFMSD